jgi:hypothetical protein
MRRNSGFKYGRARNGKRAARPLATNRAMKDTASPQITISLFRSLVLLLVNHAHQKKLVATPPVTKGSVDTNTTDLSNNQDLCAN